MTEATKEFIVQSRVPTCEEYLQLREKVGWPTLDKECADQAIENTLHGCCLEINNQVVGIGRVVGDGALYFYIQDVLVSPEYQHNGGGRLILNELMKYLAENTCSGAFIGIFAGHDVDSFMARFSFLKDSFLHMSKGMFFVKK